jgi:hypothetical protein
MSIRKTLTSIVLAAAIVGLGGCVKIKPEYKIGQEVLVTDDSSAKIFDSKSGKFEDKYEERGYLQNRNSWIYLGSTDFEYNAGIIRDNETIKLTAIIYDQETQEIALTKEEYLKKIETK